MGMVCAYLMALTGLTVSVLTGQAEETCELRTSRPEVFVPFGHWFLLNCTFNCPGTIHWETRLLKNNTQQGPTSASVDVLVDDWEKSEVYCSQLLANRSEINSVTVVMAYAEPSNVTIDMDQELEEGKVHQVICIVYDVAPVKNLQIQLLRANTVIHNSTFKGDERKGNQTVNIMYEVIAGRMDNLQNFSCLASLEVATGDFIKVSSSSKTVRTYGQPDVPVLIVTPESDIQEGSSFNITCLSDGSPSPEYYWIVPTGANVTYTRNNSVVLVTRAGQIHNGNYTCEARNKHGRVRSTKNVQVIPLTKDQPDAPVLTVTPASDIQEGNSFSITCLSHGSPSPEYHWIVPTDANVTYTRNNSVVLVTRAGQIHNGNYTCEARNIHGWARSTKNVQVIPLTKGSPRNHKADIISFVLVFIVTSVILWKTKNCTTSGDSD